MKVKPKLDYYIPGLNFGLKAGVVYPAVHACNQPEWKEEGKIFVGHMLLKREEYEVVEE